MTPIRALVAITEIGGLNRLTCALTCQVLLTGENGSSKQVDEILSNIDLKVA